MSSCSSIEKRRVVAAVTPNSRNASGFTIVELLIVIVVIGILAVITIVAYNGIQSRAQTANAQSVLAQVNKKLSVYMVEKGEYPADNAAFSALIPNTGSTNLEYSVNGSVNPATYCVTATNGVTSYKVSSTATQPTAGGCAGHGVGGVGAITNYVTNPSFESNTAGWAYRWYGNAGGAGTNSRQTNGGYAGSAYLRKTWTTAGTAADNGFNTTSSGGYVPVTAGNTYMLSAYMRSNRGDVASRPGVAWYDSTGTSIGTTQWLGSTVTPPVNTWTRIAQSATAPSGAVNALLIFSNNSVALNWAIGDTLDIDAIMFTAGTTNYTFADGTSTDWVWNGTSNNSTSTGPSS